MKTAVLHDYFESAEGGGRLCLTLACAIRADLACGFIVKNHPYFQKPFSGNIHNLQAFSKIPLFRQWKLARSFHGKTNFVRNYDTVIYSGFYAPLAIAQRKMRQNEQNILYCHTPPRFVYDQKDFFSESLPNPLRPFLSAFVEYLRPRYEKAVSKMDKIIANSQNVQKRIRDYLDMTSEVVYPPCDTEKYKWCSQEDFFLSTARVDSLKRVALTVRAFMRMPDKKLVVISGGPDLRKIRKMAAHSDNIRILGWVSEEKLHELLGTCIATIYIPIDEDFGMSPVESMAAGKPVIGVAEGGLLESVVHEKTGLLMAPNPMEEEIMDTVRKMNPKYALEMRHDCEIRAKLFDKRRFIRNMKEVIGNGY